MCEWWGKSRKAAVERDARGQWRSVGQRSSGFAPRGF